MLRLDHPARRNEVAGALDVLALAGGTPALLGHGQLELGRHGRRNFEVDVHDGLRNNGFPV